MRRLRAAAGALVASTACALALVGTSTPSASADTLTFTPVADVYVASDRPTTHLGSSRQNWIDGSPTRRTFLKFTVSGVSTPVTSARLRMHIANVTSAESNRGGTYRLISNTSWTEAGATWNAQPAVDGPTLGTLGSVSRNTWVEIDLSGRITGNGTYSIAITPNSNDGAAFDSRETGALAPQLVLVSDPLPPIGDPVLVGAVSTPAEPDSACQPKSIRRCARVAPRRCPTARSPDHSLGGSTADTCSTRSCCSAESSRPGLDADHPRGCTAVTLCRTRSRMPEHGGGTARGRSRKGTNMGKAENKATDAKGKAKEATGAATGNRDLKAEGKKDQDKAKAKEAGRHTKEAAKSAKDTVKPG